MLAEQTEGGACQRTRSDPGCDHADPPSGSGLLAAVPLLSGAPRAAPVRLSWLDAAKSDLHALGYDTFTDGTTVLEIWQPTQCSACRTVSEQEQAVRQHPVPGPSVATRLRRPARARTRELNRFNPRQAGGGEGD